MIGIRDAIRNVKEDVRDLRVAPNYMIDFPVYYSSNELKFIPWERDPPIHSEIFPESESFPAARI